MTKTKREKFEMIATLLADNAEIVDFCNHEIELLTNRKSHSKGMTATQKANVEVKAVIVNVLREVETPLTVTEILTDERLAMYSNQKISALLRQLVDAHEVIKTIEGKKAKFAIA